MSGPLQTIIRDLGRKRGRERRGLTLAEGVRLVEEAIAAGIALRGAAVSPALETTGRGHSLKSALSARRVRLQEVSDAELADLSDTEQPQGVVAVIEPRRWELGDIRVAPGSVILVLDAVQDPGNVGTMLRTALGLGASGAVALKGTAELTSPKVIRGSMGALFRLPSVASDAEEFLRWAREHEVRILVTAADGEPLRAERGSRGPVAVVVGNEGAGVGATMAAAADRRLAIPLAPGAESLNVAVAAGIFLHEVTRAD
jgi:RNA methyltransferase, TrmH family